MYKISLNSRNHKENMSVTPLNSEVANNLAHIVDRISVAILASEYADERVSASEWDQAQAHNYITDVQGKISRRTQDIENGHKVFDWADISKNSNFLSEAFNLAFQIITSRNQNKGADEINVLIHKLEQKMNEAREMRDREELADEAVLAIETAFIVATSERKITILEANILAQERFRYFYQHYKYRSVFLRNRKEAKMKQYLSNASDGSNCSYFR